MRVLRLVEIALIVVGTPLVAAVADFPGNPRPISSGTMMPVSPGPPAAIFLDLPAALELTLQHNPSLLTVRQNQSVSAQAIEVARQFPTSLNPTLSLEICPWVFQPLPGGGAEPLDTFVTASWAQPIELGHRRQRRTEMAEASYNQTRWSILQAELSALVQTYRLHQTATYRREKLGIAQRLVEFNQRLLEVLRRQQEANQVAAADVVMAEVESASTMQQWEVARQEYAASLAELRQQIGSAEHSASAEPGGRLWAPQADAFTEEAALVRMALDARPEVRSAEAQLENSRAAVELARAERIPVLSVGPAYERNETGANFYGVTLSSPIPVLNAGGPLLRQREAEYHRDSVALEQARRQVVIQTKTVLARWARVRESAARARMRAEPIGLHAERMQRLFDAGQTDLVKLLAVRQRLIEAENAELDAVWQTTQVYADLLTALGAAPLIGSLGNK